MSASEDAKIRAIADDWAAEARENFMDGYRQGKARCESPIERVLFAALLSMAGLKVLRFTGAEIWADAFMCADTIDVASCDLYKTVQKQEREKGTE